MGRPATGPVSTFPIELKEAILHLRQLHPGWGPATLLVALKTDPSWRDQPLPSRAQIARLQWEEALVSLEKVCRYLAQGRWFRSIRSNGFFGLGSYQYYLGKSFAKLSVAIGFDPDTMTLICQPEGSEQTFRLPAQGLTKAELMGELAAL